MKSAIYLFLLLGLGSGLIAKTDRTDEEYSPTQQAAIGAGITLFGGLTGALAPLGATARTFNRALSEVEATAIGLMDEVEKLLSESKSLPASVLFNLGALYGSSFLLASMVNAIQTKQSGKTLALALPSLYTGATLVGAAKGAWNTLRENK